MVIQIRCCGEMLQIGFISEHKCCKLVIQDIWVFENQYLQHQHLSGVKNCALSPLGSNLIQIRSSTSYNIILVKSTDYGSGAGSPTFDTKPTSPVHPSEPRGCQLANHHPEDTAVSGGYWRLLTSFCPDPLQNFVFGAS